MRTIPLLLKLNSKTTESPLQFQCLQYPYPYGHAFHNYDRYEDRALPSRLLFIVYSSSLFCGYILIPVTTLLSALIMVGFFSLIFLIIIEFMGRNSRPFYMWYVLVAKHILLLSVLISLILGLKLWYFFDTTGGLFLMGTSNKVTFLNFFLFAFDIDGLSINFIPVICLVFLCCLINYWSYFSSIKNLILLSFLYISILLVFVTTNAFIFYVCFELTLIPMVIMILDGGHRARRVKAMYYFFILTLIGSFFLLFGILVLYFHIGSFDYKMIYLTSVLHDRNFYNILYEWRVLFDYSQPVEDVYVILGFTQTFHYNFLPLMVWLPLAIGFAIKIPIFPFHIWLPEAHVEAPTIGSVILASLLLKLGGYGFIRFLIHLIPSGANAGLIIFFSLLCLMGIFYASLIILTQLDLKKIIAYSSIAHMNFAILGILSLNKFGFEGGYLLLLSHCFVSAALFFSVGVLYERYHTRQITSYGGLSVVMPVYAVFFLIFNLANFGFPGTSSFCAELLILIGLVQGTFVPFNGVIAFLSLFGILFSAIYSMFLFSRVIFGTYILRSEKINEPFRFRGDLDFRECFIFSQLVFFIFLIGFYPELLLSKVHLLTDLFDSFFVRFPHFRRY